jgi:hypothetical protein
MIEQLLDRLATCQLRVFQVIALPFVGGAMTCYWLIAKLRAYRQQVEYESLLKALTDYTKQLEKGEEIIGSADLTLPSSRQAVLSYWQKTQQDMKDGLIRNSHLDREHEKS